jgi:hypothetical protein
VLSADARARLKSAIWNLEEATSVTGLMEMCRKDL